MRSAPLFGGLALTALLGLAGAAPADPYDATIQVETDARCGHGDSPMFYPTNHLKAGERVRVVQELDDGWLAIVPPSGSFSWVNKAQLLINSQKQPPILIANAPEVPVRVGSNVYGGPPTVVGVKKVAGYIFTPIPDPVEKADAEGTWVPIEPPSGEHGEVRYIRAETVRKPAPAADKVTSAIGLPAAIPSAGQDAEALYKRALAAEAWNPQEAITLYNQGANVDNNPDRRIQALNRANWLRDNLRNPTQGIVAGPTPGADVRASSTPSESKVYPLAADPATPNVRLSPPQGSGSSGTNSLSATPTASWSTPGHIPNTPAGPVGPNGSNAYSTGVGWLQPSGRPAFDNRKLYVMMSDRRVPFYYVTAQPGIDLDPYVNHRVELLGEAIYSGDLRANYMRASRVELRDGQ